jgi:hypothetical protein
VPQANLVLYSSRSTLHPLEANCVLFTRLRNYQEGNLSHLLEGKTSRLVVNNNSFLIKNRESRFMDDLVLSRIHVTTGILTSQLKWISMVKTRSFTNITFTVCVNYFVDESSCPILYVTFNVRFFQGTIYLILKKLLSLLF